MRNILLILIVFLSSNISITGMEKEESESGQIAGLPNELWQEITFFLTNANTAKEAVKNIQNLFLSSKGLYRLLNEPVAKAQ